MTLAYACINVVLHLHICPEPSYMDMGSYFCLELMTQSPRQSAVTVPTNDWPPFDDPGLTLTEVDPIHDFCDNLHQVVSHLITICDNLFIFTFFSGMTTENPSYKAKCITLHSHPASHFKHSATS